MDNLRGAILMVLAMLGFAIEDMLIKLMAGDFAVGQVVIIIGAGGALVLAVMARIAGVRLWSRALLHPAALTRNACEVFGTLGFVSAIALTPISTASAILQATPLVVTLGAALFLGESVGWRRWTAIMVGLFGVLLIIRPGAADFDIKSLLAVMGVLGLAARDLATRKLPAAIPSTQIAFSAFVVSILTGCLLLWFGVTGNSWTAMDASDSAMMLLTVFVGVLAYYLIVAATRIGDVAIVSPFRYSRLVFALIVGAIVFAERPDTLTLTGATVIVASGLYTLWRETALNRRKPAL